LERAGQLPGKALYLALLLWREAGARNRRTVPLCLRGGLAPGLNRWNAGRGLQALETAGLVSVQHPPGRCLQVTILDAPATPERNGSG
jgi:hypothetical protein